MGQTETTQLNSRRGRFTLNSGLDRSAIVRQRHTINFGPIHRSNPFIRSVGHGEERWRDVNVERSRSLQVDHLVELDRHLGHRSPGLVPFRMRST
jgi:hypothetical protein